MTVILSHTPHEQLQAPVYAGGNPAGKLLGKKGPGSPGGHQVECEPAVGH